MRGVKRQMSPIGLRLGGTRGVQLGGPLNSPLDGGGGPLAASWRENTAPIKLCRDLPKRRADRLYFANGRDHVCGSLVSPGAANLGARCNCLMSDALKIAAVPAELHPSRFGRFKRSPCPL